MCDYSDYKYQTNKIPDNVFMICLGKSRIFKFTNKHTKKSTEILLENGMVLHISSECNRLYTHERPEFQTEKESYSFTFRSDK